MCVFAVIFLRRVSFFCIVWCRLFVLYLLFELSVNYLQIQVVALQCLVKIMSVYYKYMETYMGPALFAVSLLVKTYTYLLNFSPLVSEKLLPL